MFVTDLTRDTLTSPTPRWNAIVPEMDIITNINYINILGNWKNAAMQQQWFGSVTALSEPYVSLFISYKYVKYDNIVNKK